MDAARQQALISSRTQAGLTELGCLYQANGLLDQAETCWKLLLRRDPADGQASYFLADIARTRGDDESMARWLRETVAAAPSYATAWLKLADWEFKSGDMEHAERHYRRRLELAAGDPYARLGLARVAIARNQRAEARRQLEALVKDQPSFYSANNLLAEMLAESGDTEGAAAQRKLSRDALRSREAADPWLEELRERCFDATQLSLWASVELSTNHADRGMALLERAIQVDPSNPIGYTNLAQVHLKLHNPAKARSLLEVAIALPNVPSEAYAGLCQSYRDLGQPEKAAAAARAGLERLPNDANLETALGNSLRTSGRLDEAIGAYRRAVQLAPNLAETHFNLGAALVDQNRTDEAMRSLKRALELKADYAPALLALGRLTLTAGDLDTGGHCARALYQSNPQMPEARQLLAWWCLQAGSAEAKKGRFDQAEKRLQEGIAANPDLAELYARLGLLYGQEGRSDEALSTLTKYHELAPNEPMSSLFLGQAYMHLGKSSEARRFFSQGRTLATEKGDASVAALCAQLMQSLAP